MIDQKPFEGDIFIPKELIKLRDKFNIVNCVETGTQYGTSTKEFCKIFKTVNTIEADQRYFDLAKENIKGIKNVTQWLGSSESILGKVDLRKPTLFYLDAHGCEIGGCPLKDELFIIYQMNLETVCIAIHDFKVPEHPELGFDTYDFELKLEEIVTFLQLIYPNGFDYHYNSEATGAMRGIIYIYPKK